MTKDEALRLALEALGWTDEWRPQGLKEEAITAIKEALAQPEQPKVRTGNCLRVGVCASEGHKIAPQRTWVGLTDEEIWEWFRDNTALTNESGIRIVRAIEAKLKDKNT
jgi:hypothetical protein